MTADTTSQDRELPYEGTVQDFRLTAARDIYHAEDLLRGASLEAMRSPAGRAASAASMYGGGLVAVLGWLAAEHPDLVYTAACIAQDVAINGGNRWCEDIPYPPTMGEPAPDDATVLPAEHGGPAI